MQRQKEAEEGRHALAALEAKPDRIAMAEKCGESSKLGRAFARIGLSDQDRHRAFAAIED